MKCIEACNLPGQIKMPPEGGIFLILARPAGFEPTTPWFVAKYSIQLSYGRIKGEIIAVGLGKDKFPFDDVGLTLFCPP
jgi:hypothetical protein